MARPRPEVWEAPDDDRFDDQEDGEDEGEGEDECEEEDETETQEGSGGRDDQGRQGSGWHDLGMATAEYAIATLAACGFAGLLLVLLRSSEVRGLLSGIIRRALSVG
jgi:Protein of unknown function (DUF4244)